METSPNLWMTFWWGLHYPTLRSRLHCTLRVHGQGWVPRWWFPNGYKESQSTLSKVLTNMIIHSQRWWSWSHLSSVRGTNTIRWRRSPCGRKIVAHPRWRSGRNGSWSQTPVVPSHGILIWCSRPFRYYSSQPLHPRIAPSIRTAWDCHPSNSI